MKVCQAQEPLRDELVHVILQSIPELKPDLTDTTSLIQAGLVDSHGLVEIALFIEREIGRQLDFSRVNLEQEWDSIDSILQFIEKQQ